MEAIFVWNADPEIFRFGSVAVRWYGLLYATSFLVGTLIIAKMFKMEGKKPETVDRLLLYMLLAVVIGARLGEVLFYNPAYYFSKPLEIFKVWKGGLSSHGGFVGIVTAIYLYSKKTEGQPFLWVLDRIVIIVSLAGVLIRIGNFINSEIIGKPTNGNWGVVFQRIDNIPRHPAQLYESMTYFLLFLILLGIYRKVDTSKLQGMLFGIFLSVGFTARFFIEFFKEVQVSMEKGWNLHIGQYLSIPVILIGLFSLGWAFYKKPSSAKK